MGKKLFTVTVTRELLVVADDKESAEETAEDLDRLGDLATDEADVSASEMTHLPGNWEMDAIPWGDRDPKDPDRTVAKWVEMGAAPKFVEAQARGQKQLAQLQAAQAAALVASIKNPEHEDDED